MKNPKITQQKIRKNMSRCIRWGNRLTGFLGFAVDSFRSAMPWYLEWQEFAFCLLVAFGLREEKI